MMLHQLQQPLGNTQALAILAEVRRNGSFVQFAQYLFNPDERVSRNAGWVLTKASRPELLVLRPLRNDITTLALTTPSIPLRRLTLAIIERLPMDESEIRTDLLDYCLFGMRSFDEPAGIQALCMKLAFRMCRFYPELAGEFRRTLDCMEIEHYSPGVRCTYAKAIKGTL
ncbi:MAG: hypothetical protein MJZ99_04715 [Bacteroidales bacterium]|nr:hypothetical protein [Candidatus Colimorpha merdihippi]MCQ2281907.1 hypothetical protein [Bacteroidales bacterium]